MADPVVILAGGFGTRLKEETGIKPKPMIEIGGQPLLWHIMKIFSAFGHDEFVVCLGYKGDYIKDFFLNYRMRQGSLSIDLDSGDVTSHDLEQRDRWKIHLLETGYDTMTGGRVKRAAEFLGNRPFLMTYGDGVADIDINALLAFHKSHGKLATVTAVRPPARFGNLNIEGDYVQNFAEKLQDGEGWVNGGFMVLEPEIAQYIDGDTTTLERAPMEQLAQEGQLAVYRHPGFWQCVDTARDLDVMRESWDKGKPLWKNWSTQAPNRNGVVKLKTSKAKGVRS